MDTEAALRTLGRHRRRVGLDALTNYRRRLRREHTLRLWAVRFLYTATWVALTGLTVALLLSL